MAFSLFSKKTLLPLAFLVSICTHFCIRYEYFTNEVQMISIQNHLLYVRSDPFQGYPNIFDFTKLLWLLCIGGFIKTFLIGQIGNFSARDYQAFCKRTKATPSKKAFLEMERRRMYMFQQTSKTFLEKCVWKNLFGTMVFAPIVFFVKIILFFHFDMLFRIGMVTGTVAIGILGDFIDFLSLKEYRELYSQFKLRLLKVSLIILSFSFLHDLHNLATILGEPKEAVFCIGTQIGVQVFFTHSVSEFGFLAQVKNYFIQAVVSSSTSPPPKRCGENELTEPTEKPQSNNQ